MTTETLSAEEKLASAEAAHLSLPATQDFRPEPLAALGSGSSIAPTSVAFYRDGLYIMSLDGSHPSSMNSYWDNVGYDPTTALIVGPTGSVVTFFDDQNFNTDQNALTIVLTRDATPTTPVTVYLVEDRLGSGDHDNGTYKGQNTDYGWILQKNAAGNWVAVALRYADQYAPIVDAVATAAGYPWVAVAYNAGIKMLKPVGDTGHSDNSRVDNVSSCRFGAS
jgi:hypothetical protein